MKLKKKKDKIRNAQQQKFSMNTSQISAEAAEEEEEEPDFKVGEQNDISEEESII